MVRAREVLVSLVLAAAVGGAQDDPWVGSGDGPRADAEEPRGLVFRLSEAGSPGEGPALVARPPAEPLDDAATRRVLARLPPWEAEAEETGFALREDSPPPPRTGRTLETPFPPPAVVEPPEPGESGPPRVIRRAPEGEVPLAPNLAITFSRPMVEVTAHGVIAAEEAPVRLEPQPPGEWRWVGTRTLLFEPEGRFPMATAYRVEVPAGLPSATGEPLADAVRWTFGTPAARVVARHPEGGPARRDPLVFVAFDQRLDPEAVLPTVRLRAGDEERPVRLATSAEIETDPTVEALAARYPRGRWLALRAEGLLPADTAVAVEVGPGTPSAEGPRLTGARQAWSFRTRGPLRVREHGCDRPGADCPPGHPWVVRFTNPLDRDVFDSGWVRVDPPLPGLSTWVSGPQLVIHGRPRGRTHYTVTLSPEITDTFGQTLGEPTRLDIDVGPAEPGLFAAGGDLVVLDAGAPTRFPVYSVGIETLRVEARVVEPGDWSSWRTHLRLVYSNRPDTPPGRVVLDTTVSVEGSTEELVETWIDLATALDDGVGQLVLVVRPGGAREGDPGQSVRTWIQSTHIGLDAVVDDQTLVAWATGLADGRPLPGVEVALVPGGAAVTDAAGLVRLDLGSERPALLAARRGADVAFLPGGWTRRERRDALRFFMFDDRRMYRPGEEVRVKGWVRRIEAGPEGDVAAPGLAFPELVWILHDSRRNEIGRGHTSVDPRGGFDLTLTLPETANLGPASLTVEADRSDLSETRHVHVFEIQEFRRPEYEVEATVTEGPHLVGGNATATVTARYYAGGALPGAEVAWTVTATPGFYGPPHWEGFAFGPFQPWWDPWPGSPPEGRTESLAGRTDGEGRHRLRLDLESVDPPRPHHVRAAASVTDVNRQAWTASAELLVHPAAHYVGLRSEHAFVEKGDPIALEVIVTDLDGGAIPGRRVEIRAERETWEQAGGDWKRVPRDVQERATISGARPVAVRFEAREGGPWRLLARVSDEQGRWNETELQVWVAGGPVPPRRRLERAEVTLVPDREEYRAGEVARILVVAPFAPAEGLATFSREGIVSEERFRVTEGSHTLELPVEDGWTPNLHVQVDLVGATPDDAGTVRPAFARGTLDLGIPPVSRHLEVGVAPRETALAPGEETVLDLSMKDAEGRPVAGGELAVVVVDEAVLALSGYRLPDPVEAFYARRRSGTRSVGLRAHVLVPGAESAAPEAAVRSTGLARGPEGAVLAFDAPQAVMLGSAAPAPAAEPIRARTDFAALALFVPSIVTDAEGRATVPVRLPDNLTRYRVMAVAVEGARRFGSGEATLVARLPLMVRPSAPRFLNFGDRFELPVVVQNQTDRDLPVDVVVRARNAELLEGAGRRLVVAARDRAEVRFPTAVARAGSARFQIGAASADLADAAEIGLPVWTPATTEAFATYGRIDAGAVRQPVAAPSGVAPDFGGLEITTSSTALQALTDAVLYLVAYPFECAEQLSSRVLAVAALRDVLVAFEAEGLPDPEDLQEAVQRDIRRLAALQNADGGFAFWRRGERSWPWVSIHAAHALARARAKGFEIPADTLERAKAYLRGIEERIPPEYPEDVRRTVRAYALFVRHALQDADPGRARALVREAGIEGLTFEAIGWLLPSLGSDDVEPGIRAELLRRIANGVVETAGAAHLVDSYTDGAHLLLHSDRRADAVVLEALVGEEASSDLVAKLVAGLLAHRQAGRWHSTQENVFVLLALDRYFQAFEATPPDFVARAWLGARFAGEHAFRGRTTESHRVRIPMPALRAADGDAALLLAKDGPGRLYYRIGLRYSPDDLRLEPLERGFTVERTYEAVDDDEDVRRRTDGTWHIRAGASVRVRLTMVAPTRRYHVALVDPLPAGLEAVNPALAVSGGAPGDGIVPLARGGLRLPRVDLWWERPWFEHQNLRDERAEAFSSLVRAGVYSYAYVARATTPGRFVVPPPKAEEMYAPETFGRGGTDIVVVE